MGNHILYNTFIYHFIFSRVENIARKQILLPGDVSFYRTPSTPQLRICLRSISSGIWFYQFRCAFPTLIWELSVCWTDNSQTVSSQTSRQLQSQSRLRCRRVFWPDTGTFYQILITFVFVLGLLGDNKRMSSDYLPKNPYYIIVMW